MHFRQLALANRTVDDIDPARGGVQQELAPWISWRSFFPMDSHCDPHKEAESQHCGQTDYWQERVLHFALSGAARFYLFSVFYECLYGDRTTHADNDVLSAVLSELDVLVGCSQPERRWLPDSRAVWRDGFLLSGMETGGRRAWRLTPSLPLSQEHGRHHQITPSTNMDPQRLVVSEPGAKTLVLSPLEFAVPHEAAANTTATATTTEWCELHFTGGALLPVVARAQRLGEEYNAAAPFGLWIVQPDTAAMPVVVCPRGFTATWPVEEDGPE